MPLVKKEVNCTSHVLITKVNIPIVIKLIGREISNSRGRISRVIKPRIRPAQNTAVSDAIDITEKSRLAI